MRWEVHIIIEADHLSSIPAGVDRANTDTDDEGAERFDAALVEDLYTLGADRGDCQSGEKGSGAEDMRAGGGGRIISLSGNFHYSEY